MLSNLKQAVEEAIKDMVTVEHFKNGNGACKSVVSLPLMYPSGASVCIEIEEADGNCFLLSDMGKGMEEAKFSSKEDEFRRVVLKGPDATMITMKTGEVAAFIHKSQLQGAIITVANASMKAVDRAINTKG